jgi:hypothetical protein
VSPDAQICDYPKRLQDAHSVRNSRALFGDLSLSFVCPGHDLLSCFVCRQITLPSVGLQKRSPFL